MFEKFKNEIIVSEELEEYIKKVTGSIETGAWTFSGDENIINLEEERIRNTRNIIISLVQQFGGANIENRLDFHIAKKPYGFVSSCDLEIIINSAIIGELKSLLRKTKIQEEYYKGLSNSADSQILSRISKRAYFYGEGLKIMIKEKEEKIESTIKYNQPSFDFSSQSLIKSGGIKKLGSMINRR